MNEIEKVDEQCFPRKPHLLPMENTASSLGIDRSEIVYGSAPTEVIMRTGDESGGMHAGIVAIF